MTIHGNVSWFNDPFGEQTLAAVLEQINESVIAVPRRIQMAYLNPHHEPVFRRHRWLKCFCRDKPLLFTSSSASYWTNHKRG